MNNDSSLGIYRLEIPTYIAYFDDSLTGLGAVLYQVQAGQLSVIAYASKDWAQVNETIPCESLNSYPSNGL